MNKKRLPRPSDRIVEIRERRTNKLLAKLNLTRRRLEFQRRGRRSHLYIATIDNTKEVVYTVDVDS